MVLGYAGILDHCSFKRALPKASSEYHEIVLWGPVGLALFTYKGVEFFVAWGHNKVPWCSIQTFKDLSSTWGFQKLRVLRHGFDADAFMEQLEHAKLPDEVMFELFWNVPFISSRPFNITTVRPTSKSTTVEKSIVIMGRCTDREFVGRKYRYLEIFTGTQ